MPEADLLILVLVFGCVKLMFIHKVFVLYVENTLLVNAIWRGEMPVKSEKKRLKGSDGKAHFPFTNLSN